MRITELYIRGFGKFSGQRFFLEDGVQVIEGENEFGKSTLHAFIRAMLFGMERGRGRAAARDDFTRYEPWDEPGRYGGMMRFVCGDRHFRLERNFARQSERAYLVCEDDGEELSVADGDLEMLLGGVRPALFDGTVSVGQLRAQPGQPLFDALENYAANCYETGGGEFDLQAAEQVLKDRQKETAAALKEEEAALRESRQEKLQECSYLERDAQRLRSQEAERSEELQHLRAQAAEQREKMRTPGARETEQGAALQQRPAAHGRRGWGTAAVSALCLIAGAAALFSGIWSMARGLSFGWAALLFGGAVLFLCIGAVSGYISFRKKRQANDAGQPDDAGQADDGDAQEAFRRRCSRLEWEIDRLRAERAEKETLCSALKEECEELPASGRALALEKQLRALKTAREELREAARETGDAVAAALDERLEEIFAGVTGGQYSRLKREPDGKISVWDGRRRIPAERLSRGTLEQIWFSLRMAAAEMLLEEPLPVILDDAFAFYDDKRLESVLKWLSRQKKQVIIFTCHKREQEILEIVQRGAVRER